jgi:putative PEP-CTERM system histidine kinase
MIPALPAVVLLHNACAALYALLAAWVLMCRSPDRTATWLAGACLVTSAWASAIGLTAWRDPTAGIAGWLEVARAAAWSGCILHLYCRTVAVHRQLRQLFITTGLLALLVVSGLPLLHMLSSQPRDQLFSIGIAIRLGFAVCNVLLLENLYYNTPSDARWHINLLCTALAALFLYDLVLYADAALFGRLSQALFQGRASATALVVPLIAIAVARHRRWTLDLHVSRDVVFHTTSLVVSGVFLLGLAATGEIFRRGGADWGHLAEVSLIFGSALAIAVLLTSGSARSRFRAIVVDNFFSHRYDYRREWLRCIDKLATPAAHTGLPLRAIRAVADVVDGPAGVLFARAPEEVAFRCAGAWNMPASTPPVPPAHSLLAEFRGGDWVVELDRLSALPEGLSELSRAWLAVPLNHQGNLIGFVVLGRPRARFKLDREVFALLRIIGREVASRLAEQSATEVLSQTEPLRAFSQRFAFAVHDIKNVSAQLSMLLANAAVHQDNPEFQRDMLAAVRGAVDRIDGLLRRLQADRQEPSQTVIQPLQRLRNVVDATRRITGAAVDLSHDGNTAGVAIDPQSFDVVVQHLLNNAIEASGEARPVRVELRYEKSRVVVDIVDEGSGMTADFIRDELFRPFVSTKCHGHGIGAYQARALMREAGGDLLVLSRRPGGTTMRLLLPAVRLAVVDAAPVPA